MSFPTAILGILPTLDPSILGAHFGARNNDPAFDECYSKRNPANPNECVDLCLDGDWLPALIHSNGLWVAEHHLADRRHRERWAWSSGYVFDVARGKDQELIRAQAWKLAREYFESLGFRHLFCCVFAHNPWAQAWVEGACGFTRAALMREGVIARDNHRKDIILYAQRDEDVPLCIETSQRVFEGHGEIIMEHYAT